MASKLYENDSHNLLERTCRIEMDVRIHIIPITPENVSDYFTPDETGEGLSWEWAERQNRLLLALLQDEEILKQFLAHIAKSDLGFLLESQRITGLSDEAEDELLEQVYSGMDDEDAHFFQEAKKDGILYPNVELIHRAFITDWKETEIRSVAMVDENDIDSIQ